METAGSRREQKAAPDLALHDDDVAEVVTATLDQQRVRRCLDGLTELQRESIKLAYYGGYSYPVYYGAPYAVEVPVYSPPAGYQSFYPPGTVPPDAAAAPAPALSEQVVQVQVRVPGNAQVWFGGASTQQNGSVREFVSPPLVPGRDYTYQIRARWMEGGREIDQTRTVRVHAGERVTVDFTRPA